MEQNSVYLQILVESLQKKYHCLEQLTQLTEAQSELIDQMMQSSSKFNADDGYMEQFDRIMEDKQGLINELSILDSGFQSLYDGKLKEVIQNSKDIYRDEILQMQQYIKRITDLSISLECMEQKNKARLDLYFRNAKQHIREKKQGSKTVANYYKNMSNQLQEQAYFIDKKK